MSRGGARVWGNAHPAAQLTEKKVIRYRNLIRSGKATVGELAAKEGCSHGRISMAVRGETWQHLNDVAPPVPAAPRRTPAQQEARAKGARTKRAAAKRAPAKGAPTKGAPVKRAVAKRGATKTAVAKKAAAKRATVKRVPAKRVTAKAAAKRAAAKAPAAKTARR